MTYAGVRLRHQASELNSSGMSASPGSLIAPAQGRFTLAGSYRPRRQAKFRSVPEYHRGFRKHLMIMYLASKSEHFTYIVEGVTFSDRSSSSKQAQ